MNARGAMLGVLVLAAAALSAKPAAATETASAHWLRDRDTGCYIYDADAHPADSASWSGACVDRVASGNGTAVFTRSGRFAESVSGTFARGAAEGAVRVNWADGSHLEGSAVFGRFSEAAAFTPHAAGTVARTEATGAPRSITNPNLPPQDEAQAQTSVAPSSWLDELAGQKLVAADGSSLRLSTADRAVTVEIVNASGPVENTAFKFLNGNQGTISASQQSETVLGTFRVSDLGLTAEYADGRNDRLWRDASGALLLRSALADGRSFCTRWYDDGHTFTKAEREAALNEYAKQLGLSHSTADSQECVATAEEQPAAAAPAKGKHRPPAAKTATDKAASLHAPMDDGPIEVRMATVHLIDADAAADVSSRVAEPAPRPVEMAVQTDAAPQSCLSIEPENGSWGFRNACGYEVQFAYCVQGMASHACDADAHSGSAPANAFAGLFSEREAGTAQYGFRWIVCKGGSSDVEARLLRADPPVGECRKLRPGAVLLVAKVHAP